MKNAYGVDVDLDDLKHPVVDCSNDVPLTQQSDARECDINVIVARAKSGADLSRLVTGVPRYGDFTNLPDLRTAMVTVTKANEMFMSLPALVRKHFDNDPAKFMDFMAPDSLKEESNRKVALELGLFKPGEPVGRDEQLEALRSIDATLKSTAGGKHKAKPHSEPEE